MTDYETSYEQNWKDAIENKDGSVNLDQVKRELFDYSNFLEEASKVYSELTGGRISKPNTMAFEVISEAEAVFQNWVDEAATKIVNAVIDVFEECDDEEDPQSLREQVLAAMNVTEHLQ